MSRIEWRWFHTFTASGELQYQGEVLAVLPNGDLRVQLFSFLDGTPTIQEVWLLKELPDKRMQFYQSAQEMRMVDVLK